MSWMSIRTFHVHEKIAFMQSVNLFSMRLFKPTIYSDFPVYCLYRQETVG